MRQINYLGETFTTKYDFDLLSDEEYKQIKSEFYEKPNLRTVKRQIKQLIKGGKCHNYIINYFLNELIYDCKLKGAKWTINEFMESKELVSFAIYKMKHFPKVYNMDNVIQSLKTFFRIGSSMTAPKVSNYPYESAIEILKKYNVNNNYYDYSCGWGIRLLASISSRINYYGTDVNHLLVNKLQEIAKLYKRGYLFSPKVDIRCSGSEMFHKEWENKMGLCFSSPPYYDFEDYKHGNQSSRDNYETWLKDYWTNTVKNVHRYMIDEGYFLLNMKNNKDYALLDDMHDIVLANGFTYIGFEILDNINRIILHQNNKDNNEKIMVYKKTL